MNLENLSRRFGLTMDGGALVCGNARISPIDGTGDLAVSTSDPRTAQALDDSGVGSVLYRMPREGRLSLAFDPRDLGRVVAAIERLELPEEPLPSYGRSVGYGRQAS